MARMQAFSDHHGQYRPLEARRCGLLLYLQGSEVSWSSRMRVWCIYRDGCSDEKRRSLVVTREQLEQLRVGFVIGDGEIGRRAATRDPGPLRSQGLRLLPKRRDRRAPSNASANPTDARVAARSPVRRERRSPAAMTQVSHSNRSLNVMTAGT